MGVPVDGLTRVRAHIVLRQDYEPSEVLVTELQNWCKERLKRYQYPHLVEFVDELPKTVTGKIQRFKLREPETGVQMPRQEGRAGLGRIVTRIKEAWIVGAEVLL